MKTTYRSAGSRGASASAPPTVRYRRAPSTRAPSGPRYAASTTASSAGGSAARTAAGAATARSAGASAARSRLRAGLSDSTGSSAARPPHPTSLAREVEQVPQRLDRAHVPRVLPGIGRGVEELGAPEVADRLT